MGGGDSWVDTFGAGSGVLLKIEQKCAKGGEIGGSENLGKKGHWSRSYRKMLKKGL